MSPFPSSPGSEYDPVTILDIEEPKMYRVLLHNDNYTTMEFVVDILMSIFNKTFDDATLIMLSVHEKGIGLCGIYTAEIAETKVTQVHDKARKAGYPLRCSMEEE